MTHVTHLCEGILIFYNSFIWNEAAIVVILATKSGTISVVKLPRTRTINISLASYFEIYEHHPFNFKEKMSCIKQIDKKKVPTERVQTICFFFKYLKWEGSLFPIHEKSTNRHIDKVIGLLLYHYLYLNLINIRRALRIK